MDTKSRATRSSGPWLWPLALTIIGVVLLLDNFLLIEGFDVTSLWPLILVIIGAQILIRGDLLPRSDARTFGITRGSVQQGSLEINAADIDVYIQPLQREGRLIAGQYAAQSRPELNVDDRHAYLRLNRAQTPWLSFVDWQIRIAKDLPWQIFVSAHLGQASLDLSETIIQDAIVATGFGDIELVCPREALGKISLRSTLGNVRVITPRGYRSRIVVRGSRLLRVHIDMERYEQQGDGVYTSLIPDDEAPLVEVAVSGTFGDAYLA